MNDDNSNQIIDSSNLPANKKAKAIQKRRAAENTYEALQLKKSAAIYLRVSSEMQVDGFSIEAQKMACLKYAHEQGYEVSDSYIYIDEAYSAKTEERPEFKRLMILFIPIGCITWGMTACLAGLLAGICVGSILAVSEWIFFRRVSYGGGDTVYGAMASALIGYSNFCLYWGCFTLILVLAAAVHVILVKAVRKQKLSDNRFVPLLPWFSILTTVLYAVQIINI